MRREIVDAFIEHNGLVVHGGDVETNEIFMPYFLMDIVLQIRSSHVDRYRHREHPHWKMAWRKSYTKYLRIWRVSLEAWKDAYTRFNLAFFDSFTPVQACEVTDKMDELMDVAGESLARLEEEIDACMGKVHPEEREILRKLMMCSTITRTAQVFWERFYRIGKGKNLELEVVSEAVTNLVLLSYTGEDNVSFNDSKGMDEAVQRLCRTLVEWARKKEVDG